MIVAVTGSPGSGKSYYCIRKMAAALDSGKMVATNVTLRPDWSMVLGRRNLLSRLLPGRAAAKAADYDRRLHYAPDLSELMRVKLSGKGEGRGIAIIDEAHEWLNNRSWKDEGRADFVKWFAEHRKLGWDVYLITQHLDSIDKQVRDRIEFHVILRNVKNLRFMGIRVVPFNLFMAIWIWAGGPKTVKHIAKRESFLLNKTRELYDSWALVHDVSAEDQEGETIILPRPDPLRDVALGRLRPSVVPAPSLGLMRSVSSVSTGQLCSKGCHELPAGARFDPHNGEPIAA